MAVDAVTRRDVAARLVAITRANGSIVAARARGALSTFYVWAMGNGLAETNASHRNAEAAGCSTTFEGIG